MISMLVGIIFLFFTVFALLPMGLGWGPEVILFLKGCSPVLAGFVGLLAIFIGIADIKDKHEAKKEELAAQEECKNK